MPGPEANTVNVAKMCSAFAGEGCDVTLAALPGAPTDQLHERIHSAYDVANPFAVRALAKACARPSMAALAAAGLTRRLRPNLVYTRAPHVALATCIAGACTVLELHASEEAFSAAGRAALGAVLRHPKLVGVVAISEALARHLIAGGVARNVVIAHDGADPRPTAPPPPPRERLLIGFVGRYYTGKGLELIARLAPLCPWADFHLLGGDEIAATRLLRGPLAGNVICHGAKQHSEAIDFIDGCDAVLAPYQRVVRVADGVTDAARWMSPLKIFEYMAAGKPILASDLPVLREILTDGDTAQLLPPDDPLAWAAALTALRDNPTARIALGQRGRSRFLAHHTWSARAGHILAALNRTPAKSAA